MLLVPCALRTKAKEVKEAKGVKKAKEAKETKEAQKPRKPDDSCFSCAPLRLSAPAKLSSFHFLIVPFCTVFSLPVLLFKNEIKGLKN